MVGFHSTVGTLVLIGYFVLAIVNLLALRGGQYPWARQLSFFAAGLLLLQYVVGFALLADHDITGWHYILAISAILAVGFEHGYANSRETRVERARFAASASAATFTILLVTYIIGQSN
jgi:hypothetical protein